MDSKAPEKNASAGFTLIELVIAIVVFAVGIVGVLKMHQASVQANNFSMQLTEAVNAAEDQKEALRGLPFEHTSMTIGTHGTTGVTLRNITYNVSYRVEQTPGTFSQGRTVTLTVTWQERGIPHLFTLPFIMDEVD
ncbi:MAG TPA: prepilin-type N-terminal cleavage/methylation domain-containing protein [Deltaproteobacteria bacterium]|nr:prepilin-type N-terminal cleavage/methylation domain-containing protein [Deltaproteobacteria bacterium]HQI79978.1 prepilin-type N-terminal cleavage/methylation domain-containing protein [Deltaproteobacteria bacterium]